MTRKSPPLPLAGEGWGEGRLPKSAALKYSTSRLYKGAPEPDKKHIPDLRMH